MADDRNDSERSEDPTQKRLDEALQRGDVAKSQEVSTWFVMAAGALVLATFSSPMSGGLSTTFRGIMANAHQIPMDGRGVMGISVRLCFEVISSVAAPLGILVLAAGTAKEGPGPLVTSIGKTAGTFPIPVAIVPGHLSDEELDASS